MEIEALAELPDVPEDFLHQQQATLDVTVSEFLSHRRPLSFCQSVAYQACETLCLLGREQDVLRRLRAQTEVHVEDAVKILMSPVTASPPTSWEEAWISRLLGFWDSVDEGLTLVEFVMAPLDRGYVLNTDDECIRRIVQRQLSRALQSTPDFLAWTLRAVLSCINAQRTGESPISHEKQQALARIVAMLECLELYAGEFEQTILTSSRSFYEMEGTRLTQDHAFTSAAFVKSIDWRLREEGRAIAPILQLYTVPLLTNVILDELLTMHSSKALYGPTGEPRCEEGVYKLIMEEDIGTLKTMSSLFAQTDSRAEFRTAWQAAIKSAGARLIQEKIPPRATTSESSSSALSAFLLSAPSAEAVARGGGQQKTLIYELIKFKLSLARTQAEVFGSAEDFDHAAKDAWVSFLNASPDLANIVACLVARYADDLLRAGSTTTASRVVSQAAPATAEDMEIHLDRIIALFKFLQAKDVFKAFYEKDLGRRLLLGRAASLDREKLFVKKLRAECGPAYTSRMESMFRELELSKATFSNFKQDPDAAAAVAATGVQFECRVLAAGIWPVPAPTGPEPVLPPVMVALQQAYKEFYEKLQKGRILQWAPALGGCIVRGNYGSPEAPRKHDLVVSQYQALCLLLFNEADELSVDDIARATNIGVEELHRQLLALYVDPKRRILLKTPEAMRELSGTDRYRVNSEFASKLLRVVISQITLKETKEEVEQTEQRVEEDRTYHIDALIVRLMKSHKEMKHNALMSEVLTNLLFKASPATVKTRIETLIEREFIGRNADDPQTYHYIA